MNIFVSTWNIYISWKYLILRIEKKRKKKKNGYEIDRKTENTKNHNNYFF